MTDSVNAISLGAAFVAGVSGSMHCFAMCGGLAGALGMRARTIGQSPQRAFSFALLTQLGRVMSYGVVGAIAGTTGAALSAIMDLVHAAMWLRIVAGVLLLAVALRIAVGWNVFSGLERVGAKLWSRYFAKLAPMNATNSSRAGSSRAGSSHPGIAQSLLFGAVWGWLPCGLVYSMVLFAVFAGTAWQGALVMLAFGAGTLPAMLSSSLLATQLARVLKQAGARWVAALALVTFGVWTIVSALQHAGHH